MQGGDPSVGGAKAVPVRIDRWRSGRRLVVVLAALAACALAGCEDAQQCFPAGARCDQAAGFSDYFDSNVPCCEGSCKTAPTRPAGITGTYLTCQ